MTRVLKRNDTVIGSLLLLGLALFIAAPLIGVLIWAFAEQWRAPALLPTEWGVKYWHALLARADVQSSLPLSLILAGIVTGLSAVLCLPAAYAFARTEFPGRRLLLLSAITVHAFPRFPLYVSIAVIFLSLGLIGTAPAVVMVQLVFSMLYLIWIPTAAFRGVDRRLEEAARDVGASHMTVLLRITLPQVAPAIAAGLLLTFMNAFYEVEGALLVGIPAIRTLPIVMLSLITGQVIVQYGAVLSVMLWVPSLLVLIFSRRMFDSRTFAAGLNV